MKTTTAALALATVLASGGAPGSALAQTAPVAADMQALLDAGKGAGDRPDLTRGAKALAAKRPAPAGDGVAVETLSYAADPAQTARIYTPQGATHGPKAPLMVYFHAGWASGRLDDGDATCRSLALRANAVVVSIDYRRTPQHPYPSQRADATYAWAWATRNAPKWRANRGEAVAVGEGQGADLALVVAVKARVAPVTKPSAILLIDPVVHQPGLAEDADLTRLDLSGLAPVTIINAGAGAHLAGGEALEAALKAAGTPVERRVIPGVVEGFFGYGGLVRGAYDAQGYVYDRLRRGFGVIYPGEPGSFVKAKPAAGG